LSIYSKTEKDTISDDELKEVLKFFELWYWFHADSNLT
jgi:hypothetical protein